MTPYAPAGAEPAASGPTPNAAPPAAPAAVARSSAAGQGHLRIPRRLAVLGLAVTAVLAVALRLRASSPLWLDEAQSVGIAQLPLGQLFEALRADGAPPLYYLLLHGWIGLFGTGDVAVRSLSVVFGLIAIALLVLAGRRVTGSWAVAVTAGVVGATNPWMIRFSGETRMYALVACLVLLGVLAFQASWSRGRLRDCAGLALSAGALLLTHYWALFLLAALGLGLLGLALRRDARGRAVRCLAAVAAGGMLFLPWVPSFLYQVSRTGAPWADLPGISRLASLPLDWSGGDLPGGRWLLLLFLPLMVLGALAASRRSGLAAGGRFTGEVTVGPSVGAWLAALTAGTLLLAVSVTRLTHSGIEPRYTAVVVPLVLLLVARGAQALPRRLAVAMTVALAGVGLLASWEVTSQRRTEAGDLAQAIRDYAAPGDVVVYCPDQLAPSLTRLLSRDGTPPVESITVPAQQRLGVVDWVDYEKRIEDTSALRVAQDAVRQAGGGAVWTLTSPRYRTHDEVCGRLRDELADGGLRARNVAGMDTSAYEYALLERWTPRSPWEAAVARFSRLGSGQPVER